MNSVHENKDWQGNNCQQPPLQTPPIALDSAASPKLSHSANAFPTSPANAYQQNNVYRAQSQQNMQQPYTPTETDPNARLPGMMAHSQPGTPCPENNNGNVTNLTSEPALYQQPPPFATRNVCRGRSNLFANETGPYFSSSKPFDNLYASDKQTLLSVRVQSKMDRGFFLADNDWTCYRRNYFQVSSVFSVHGFNHYYSINEPRVYVKSDEDGALYPVQRFLLGISARVANSEKEIDLIQHTPKRDKGPQFKPDPKPISPGGNLTMSSVANNQNIVTFERVQFKTATANNGKRRAAQQYYICITELYAETDRNQLVKVASCQSAPLVVRGRSPGHYADNQERHHPYAASSSAPINSVSDAMTSQPMTPQPTPPIHQENNNRQMMYNSYPKTPTQETSPMMQHGYDQPNPPPPPPPQVQQQQQQQQQQSSYSYYPAYPSYSHVQGQQPQQHQMAPSVSSPMSHPPMPSPYAHHPQVNYAVHDGNHSNPYGNEVYHNNSTPTTEEPKMPHHFHMQQTGPIESPHSGYDWQRARYNSSSSGSSSVPSPGGQQGEPQQAYFPHHHHPEGRPYSPTTPTYPPNMMQSRKYSSTVSNLMNKQQLA
ncbi:Meiosis-specific transcription factor NDT80 [Choanephora cucurbitarum]|uniref:Meiosis-specific transcription factor NDT80 n=1 Tax=Choanephora cucurbitarum TaxID=101091 RepID=A0A1C7NP22_9FUNG|nr:Meiosis-specific transcription factor NDT80 [Choanephora cucurbitarum]